MLWNAHNTTRRLYSKYEKQIFLALAFFTFVKAYTRENGFASGTSGAKRFLQGTAFLVKRSYQRRNRRGSGGNARDAAAWRSIFFGDGGSVADRPAVEPVGPGPAVKAFKQVRQ